MTHEEGNPRHLTDEDRMAAAIAMVGAIRRRHATGVDAIQAAVLGSEDDGLGRQSCECAAAAPS